MPDLSVIPPEVYVKISATPTEFNRLAKPGLLDGLLMALGKTGPLFVTAEAGRYEIVTDGIRCSLKLNNPDAKWVRPSLDIRINALPRLTGVFNERVKTAVSELVDGLGPGGDDLECHWIPGFHRINMDAMRMQYGDRPAAWPLSRQPEPVWIIKKSGVFVQIRLLGPFEANG